MLKNKFPLLLPSVEAPNKFPFVENSRLLGPFCRRRQKTYIHIWESTWKRVEAIGRSANTSHFSGLSGRSWKKVKPKGGSWKPVEVNASPCKLPGKRYWKLPPKKLPLKLP